MNKTPDKENDRLKHLQNKNRDLISKMNFRMAKLSTLVMASRYTKSSQHNNQFNATQNFKNCCCKSNINKLSSVKLRLDKSNNENYSASTPKHFSTNCKSEKFQNNLKSVGNSRIGNPVFSNTPKKIQSFINQLKDDSKSQKKTNKVCFASDKKKKFKKYHKEKLDCSMLGYDWIAGMLENDSYINEKSDEFFDEICKFRQTNAEDCRSDTFLPSEYSENMLFTSSFKSKGSSYMINNRLNFIPVPNFTNILCETNNNLISNFKSDCVRVTIPKSACKTEYKVRSHRRKSFDPTDSVALSMHCLAGWRNSKPLLAPGPKNIDLKSHILPQKSKLKLKTR
ncbi:migration and invasion-inhibitory protein isoform X4 [Hydra vulgaris]|uniref:Migration and invasion-inhibitory protein isoform X4 n=2 Tax=Hydra vulgaris TaxID=6087 RepID=A0ABM4CZL4_HYDVU